MLIIKNDAKSTISHSLKKLLLIATISYLPFTNVTANEVTSEQYSKSQGMPKKDLSEQQRKIIIQANKLAQLPDQLSGKATAKTRTEILNSQKKNNKMAKNSSMTHNNGHSSANRDYYADFVIYGASSLLQDDYDDDGFYQTFSVTFDADIYSYTENQFGEVYALLYLSKNGGPWTHYFTTDNFIIEGDTDLDEYEVITTFLSGYSTDYYDVLIDLYQVGYSDIVASYSSDDTNALYALPLESADFNEPYVEVVEISGGGIYWLIVILLSSYFLRFRNHLTA